MAVYHRHPGAFPLNFIIIGAGGTGSRLIPMVAQLLQSLPYLTNLRPTMFVIDDDIVEQKNLARQLFAPGDVGKNKARVLVDRYSSFYPAIEMHAISERVVDRHSLPSFTIGTLVEAGVQPQQAVKMMARRTVIVMAVDSMDSRRKCLASALHLPSPLNITFIDPGNEDTFGQVAIFNGVAQVKTTYPTIAKRIADIPDLCPVKIETAYIPMPLTHYFLTPDGERTGGCADLDQTLALNALAATRCFDYIQAMMFNYPITTYITRFALGGEASCQKMDTAWLKRCTRGELPGFSDYERIQEMFNVNSEEEFQDLIVTSTSAGDTLAKRMKDKDAVLSPELVDILNAVYFLPCFDLDAAEATLKKYHEEKIEAARKAVDEAKKATPKTGAA